MRWSKPAGDIEKAIDMLRKKGRRRREEGAARRRRKDWSATTFTPAGKSACSSKSIASSDFVARTEDFQQLCHDVAMHIAALDPRYLRREEVTQEMLDREREIYKRAGEGDRQAREP